MTDIVEISAKTVANAFQNNDQWSPSIAHLADGGWVLTWHSLDQDGSSYGVYQRRFDSDGISTGPDVRVNTYTSDAQWQPSVTSLADGGWVVTWQAYAQENANSGANFGIFQQRYDSDGNAVGTEGLVNTTVRDNQTDTSVAGLPDGGWIVTWQSYGQTSATYAYNIYQQQFDADGLPVGSETRVSTTGGGAQYPEVAVLSDGGWVVSWSFGSSGDRMIGFQQRYSSDGAALGSETRIDVDTSNQSISGIAALVDGGWVVTWQTHDEATHDYDLYQQRYSSSGEPVGSPGRINAADLGLDVGSSVTSLPDGGWVVAWLTRQPGDIGQGAIYQRYYDSAGATSGPDILVSEGPFAEKSLPVITALADGTWVIAWSGEDSSGLGLYQQHYALPDEPPSNSVPTYPYEATEDTALKLTGLAVSDPDSANLTITLLVLNGTLTVDDSLSGGAAVGTNGTARVTLTGSVAEIMISLDAVSYQSTQNYQGSDTLTLQSFDGALGDTAAVEITVSAVNDAPITGSASDDKAGMEDVTLTGQLTAGTDVDGDALTYSLVANSATHGSVSVNPDGSYTFTPDDHFNGTASFQYVVNDGTVDSAAKTVALTLAAANDAPTVKAAVGDHVAKEDTAFSLRIDPSSIFTDVDGDTLSLSVSGLPKWLDYDVATGTVSGTPWQGTVGTVTINLTATDTSGATVSDTFLINVDDNLGVAWTGTKKADNKLGTSGQDRLDGGDGDDSINAGAGSDWVVGGRGQDVLTSGDGWDTFQFDPKSGRDVVTDFKLGVDRLHLVDQVTITQLQEIDTDSNSVADATLVSFSNSDSVLLEGVTGATRMALMTPEWMV